MAVLGMLIPVRQPALLYFSFPTVAHHNAEPSQAREKKKKSRMIQRILHFFSRDRTTGYHRSIQRKNAHFRQRKDIFEWLFSLTLRLGNYLVVFGRPSPTIVRLHRMPRKRSSIFSTNLTMLTCTASNLNLASLPDQTWLAAAASCLIFFRVLFAWRARRTSAILFLICCLQVLRWPRPVKRRDVCFDWHGAEGFRKEVHGWGDCESTHRDVFPRASPAGRVDLCVYVVRGRRLVVTRRLDDVKVLPVVQNNTRANKNGHRPVTVGRVFFRRSDELFEWLPQPQNVQLSSERVTSETSSLLTRPQLKPNWSLSSFLVSMPLFGTDYCGPVRRAQHPPLWSRPVLQDFAYFTHSLSRGRSSFKNRAICL